MALLSAPSLVDSAPAELAAQAPRFWSQVDRPAPESCWPFTGDRQQRVRWMAGGLRRCLPAPTVAYILSRGPVLVDQRATCRLGLSRCCNPEHLELVALRRDPSANVAEGVPVTIGAYLLRKISTQYPLSHVEFRVYVCLLSHQNAKGWAWPSQQTLAREAQCAHSMVGPALQSLEAKGLIVRYAGKRTSATYRFQVPEDWEPYR